MIKFALVGCGRIAKNHILAIETLPDAQLVAVCDIKRERAAQYGEKCGVPVYVDYREMLEKERVDVVSILTPSGMHPSHAIDIMARGKHIVVEKPMALALADLDRMKVAADKNKVRIFPIYQNRFNKAVQRVKRDLDSGKLGKPVLGAVRVRWARGQGYYDRDPWRGTWALDGGALTNQGIHYVDLLRYLMGDVVSVQARKATRLVDVEVEDTAVATVQFASGALGVIEVTTATRPDDIEASISVLAGNGSAVLGGIACNKLDVYTLDASAVQGESEDFPDAYGFGHIPFFAAAIEELQRGTPHPVSFDDGAATVAFLNALYASSERGAELFLKDRPASKLLGRPDPELMKLYDCECLFGRGSRG